MAKGYQRHATGGSFKRQDFGDLGLRSYRDQQKEIIDALKLQQARSKEYGTGYISSLEGVHSSEQKNLQTLQDLEDKVYQNKRGNIEKRGQREVEALKAQADEAGRKSQFWMDFSTTYAKQWGELAGGIQKFADYKFGTAENEKREIDGTNDKYVDATKAVANGLDKRISEAIDKNSERELRNGLSKNKLSNSVHNSYLTLNNFKNIKSEFLSMVKDVSKEKYGSTTAKSAIVGAAYDYLIANNTNWNTPGGREVLKIARVMGDQEASRLSLGGQVDEDDKLGKSLAIKFLSIYNAPGTTKEDKDRAFNDIVRHFQSATIKTEGGVERAADLPTGIRNPRVAWQLAKPYVYNALDSKSSLRIDGDAFGELIGGGVILPSKDNPNPTVSWKDKHRVHWEDFIFTKFKGLKEAEAQKELDLIDYNENLKPQADFLLTVRDKPNWKSNWTKDGPVQRLIALRDASKNDNFKKWANDQIGFDPEKHAQWHLHAEYMQILKNPNAFNIQRAVYLYDRFDDNKRKAYTADHKALIDLTHSGHFEEDSLGKTLVSTRAAKGPFGRTGGLTENAKKTIKKIDSYVLREFTLLTDIKDPRKRYQQARDNTTKLFNQGIKEGTGYFAARSPLSGEPGKGQMDYVWTGWDLEDKTHKPYEPLDMIEKLYGNDKDYESVSESIKSGFILSHDGAVSIVSSVIEGNWDGTVPVNVKNWAKLNNFDDGEALNYILKTMGFKTQIPAKSTDQIKKAGGQPIATLSSRHTYPVQMWTAWVNEKKGFPNYRSPEWMDWKEERRIRKESIEHFNSTGIKLDYQYNKEEREVLN